MESIWRTELWVPTVAAGHYTPLPADIHERMIKHLQVYTRNISFLAYDPATWLHRGQALLLLGYPELSVGDVYKAQLLVEAATEDAKTLLGQQAIVSFAWRLWFDACRNAGSSDRVAYPNPSTDALIQKKLIELHLEICDAMIRGLHATASDWACLEACQRALKKFPSNPTFLRTLPDLQDIVNLKSQNPKPTHLGAEYFSESLRNGQVLMKAYPWMTPDFLRRDERTLQTIKEGLEAFSKCTIGPSSIKDTRAPEADVLGVFATRDIRCNETILTDRTLVGVTTLINKCSACCGSLPSRGCVILPCCSVQHCNQKCAQEAVSAFHSAICGQNFLAVTKSARYTGNKYLSNAIRSLHLLRILAIVVKEGVHPLKSSVISRLTAQYEGDSRQVFDFNTDIVDTTNFLQTFGVDIFADVRYDTWVLRTVLGRTLNNVSGGPLKKGYRSSNNLLYSMFNHSHENNVEYHPIGDSTTMKLWAARNIQKGEELFICYKATGSLRLWLGRECGCPKCERELNK